MARLSLLDSSFVLFESLTAPQHVSGLMVMQPSEDEQEHFAGKLHTKLLAEQTVLAPFNRTVELSLTGLPKWKTVRDIDLRYHVRLHHLPKPGNHQQLMDLVGSIHGQLLDRSRPLWECHIIDGIEDGQVAMVSKIHHAIGDGNKLNKITERFISTEADDFAIKPFWAMEPSSRSRQRKEKQLLDRALGLTHGMLGQAKTLPGLARLSANSVMKLLKLQHNRVPVPFTAPKSPLTFTQRQARSVAGGSIPLATFKRISRLTGASVNEIILTVSDMALHQYFADQQWQLKKPLIALVPVNLKQGSNSKDNLFSPALIELGSKNGLPSQRLAEIMASSQDVKDEALHFSPEAFFNFSIATGTLNLLQGKLGLNTLFNPASNLIISNVPGPKQTRYLMGAQVTAIYPYGVLTPGQTLNITMFSYDGDIFFGLNACRSTLPAVDKLLAYHQKALQQLEVDVLTQASQAFGIDIDLEQATLPLEEEIEPEAA